MADCLDCAGRTGDDGYPVRCYHHPTLNAPIDIVTRLRDQSQAPALAWLADAADEIERLRAENARLSLDLMTALGELMEVNHD